MSFDFALILSVATLVTGVIWLLDSLLFRKARLARANAPQSDPVLVDWSRSLFPVLLIVLLFRSFLFEPFKIPTGSMIPTLLEGDFILVNKFHYGLRLPVLNTKFVELNVPDRGDVIVFRKPGVRGRDADAGVNFIKRVVGLPGDTIAYRNKRLFINGEPVAAEFDKEMTASDLKCRRPASRTQRFVEQLGDVRHATLVRQNYNVLPAASWIVPEDHYFVMGDNRDNSNDSRGWGFVPEKNLVGKAVRIWLNWDYQRGCADWSRVGDRIE